MTQNLKVWIVAVALLLGALHQDFWLWDNTNLMLGFLPVGLAYHVLFSIAAAVAWFLAIQFAWPDELLRQFNASGQGKEGEASR